ncbi:MAG TPA: YicC/YloC family endoribonuclease [Bauldia sp.]|nr:YicC/YloC family endoribonuclease [Bauldia sp.]
MALESMTGFARADGGAVFRWSWELRSVNGKGLDIRIRVPAGYERLEPAIRERISARLTRGNVQAILSVDGRLSGQRVTIDEAVLGQLIEAMSRIGERIVVQPPTLDGLLSIRGVVNVDEAETDEAARTAIDAELIAGLDAAITDLVRSRQREGDAIGGLLAARIDEIAALTRRAEAAPARQPEIIRARLAEQIATLLDAAPALDPDRLYQEAVILATRADIREEIDRLDAHVAAARDLLAKGGAVGRRLDFLAQEFNREVNTLCAKSNDRGITAIGLEMKAVVDQLREQIQNLE